VELDRPGSQPRLAEIADREPQLQLAVVAIKTSGRV
jgi:hypothetical protein